MSLAIDLMGVGLPQQQATRLGTAVLTTLAGAGTAQSGAAAITVNNTLGTTAGGATAFVLPSTAELELPYLFKNASATAALVYPPTSGILNNQSVNTSYSVSQGQSAVFTRKSLTAWSVYSTAEPNILATDNTWTGATTFSNTVTVGVDDTGYDVQFFGDTAGKSWLWDTSADKAFNTGALAVRGVLTGLQGAPTAKTVTAAISAAELLAGIITTTGVTAPSIHQLPTGTLLAAQFPGIAVGDCFDFSVINTGTGASDDATLTVNTDVTIVGNPTIGALTDATIIAGSGRFRARYTATNTWVVYRLA